MSERNEREFKRALDRWIEREQPMEPDADEVEALITNELVQEKLDSLSAWRKRAGIKEKARP